MPRGHRLLASFGRWFVTPHSPSPLALVDVQPLPGLTSLEPSDRCTGTPPTPLESFPVESSSGPPPHFSLCTEPRALSCLVMLIQCHHSFRQFFHGTGARTVGAHGSHSPILVNSLPSTAYCLARRAVTQPLPKQEMDMQHLGQFAAPRMQLPVVSRYLRRTAGIVP